jgi:integrase
MSCKVRVNKHGNLCLRLFWQGREWQERVTTRGRPARDNPENRKRAEVDADRINEQMSAGKFEYLKWFPDGNRSEEFRPKIVKAIEIKPQTVRQFYEEWVEKKKPPFVRLSLQRDYRQSFTKNILPFMGDAELNSVTVDMLENFRIHLVTERGLALKTARNIIDGSLKAMLRDAGRRLDRNPLNDLPANWWPRLPQKESDPYTEGERDAILAYYRSNRPRWAYAFVFFRFYTGTRPSEA